jgi:hypothetical protein
VEVIGMSTREFHVPLPDGSTQIVEAPEGWTQQEVRKAAEERFYSRARKARLISKTASGASFGFNDELTGIGNAVLPLASESDKGYFEGMGERYEEGRDAVRQLEDLYGQDKTFWDQALGLAFEFGGGAITGASLLKAIRWLRGGKNSLIPASVAGGALAGVGAGETAEERVGGGVTGGVVGGALGVGGKVVEDMLPGVGTRGRAREEMLGGRSPENAAAQIEELQQGFTEPWARYAHVEPTGTQTGYAAASPGKRAELEATLTATQRRQGPLMEQATRDITGVQGTRSGADEALLAQRRAEGRQMYDPLRGETVDITPALEASLNTPAGQDAMQATLRSLQTQRRNPDLTFADVQDDFDFWHGYQQVLRDMAGKRSVSTQPLSGPEARAIGELRNEVMEELTGGQTWGEDYALATARFRENSEVLEALTDSEKFARLSRDKLQRALGKLETDEERTAFATGVINDLIEKALQTGDETGNVARTLIKSPALREKLGMVLGPEKADELEVAMRKLSSIAEARGTILGNSATQGRQARQAAVAGPNAGGAVRSALNLDIGNALMQALDIGGSPLIPQKVADDMVDLALSDPEGFANALAHLERQSKNWNTGFGSIIGGLNATLMD